MKRIKIWLNGLSTVSRAAIVATISILCIGVIGATAQQADNIITTPTADPTIQTIKPEPKIEIKPLVVTEAIPYTSSTIYDNSLDQGITQTQTKGVNGVLTHIYQVTYTDGVETSRSVSVDTITTPVTNEVIAIGTKAPAPTCENGTYVNSAGNTVCSPYSSPSAPAGASAQCGDGTYSFSQSRRGTCSHHGGVAIWL
jgi:hypothetical protein